MLLVVVMMSVSVMAQAQVAKASVDRIEPFILQGFLSLDIDFGMELSPAMREALERGVPLSFTIELQIEQPRWWWLNKTLVNASMSRRIFYNTLTQQWRVSIGDLGFMVGSFQEALDIVKRVRGWEVAPLDRFEHNTNYVGQVRIMLDTTQLSRPLQLDASKRDDWNMASPWRSFEFSVNGPAGARP